MTNNYILILVWILILGVFSCFVNVNRKELVCGKEENRCYWMWAIIVFLPLIIWCGYRGHVGDTGAYIEGFSNMPVSLGDISGYLTTISKDKGFFFISAVIKCIIGNHVEFYFIILAALQAGALIYVYRKYSSRYLVSFFLFIASTDYISWMFNGIRQFLAVTLTFWGIGLILKKKYAAMIILILVASTVHQSALLLIPFIFIAQGKAWNKKTIIFIIAIIIIISFVGNFTNILDSMLEETQYKNVVSDWQGRQDDGTNIFRVLVYAVPSILSLVGLRYIKEADNPLINLCTNMSIVAVGFYVISMFTSGIFIGRLPIYFSLYSYILLPWEIEHMLDEKSYKIVYALMIIFYLLFYLYSTSLMGMI